MLGEIEQSDLANYCYQHINIKLNAYQNIEMLLFNIDILGSYLIEVFIFSCISNIAFACLYCLHDDMSCLFECMHVLRYPFSCVLY